MIRAALAVVVALVVIMLGGGAYLFFQGHQAPSGSGQYVALGSSFGTGPGVGNRAPNSPRSCMRSDSNYAHLLAQARHLDLTDVTCSGATALNVLEGTRLQAPQIDALRPETELVTVTVGGNDIYYLGNLMAWSCATGDTRLPWLLRVSPLCTPKSEQEVAQGAAQLPCRLSKIASEVRRLAPRATLVFVDYTTVLPNTGGCPDRLPITAAQMELGRKTAQDLASMTAKAATDAGALLVRASEVTRGHDVCSVDPWVYGLEMGSPLEYGPIPYHPREQAMRAIAHAIDEALAAKPSAANHG